MKIQQILLLSFSFLSGKMALFEWITRLINCEKNQTAWNKIAKDPVTITITFLKKFIIKLSACKTYP